MMLMVGAVNGATLLFLQSVDICYRWLVPVVRDTPLFGRG